MDGNTTERMKGKQGCKLSSVLGLLLCIIFSVMLVCNLTIIVKGTLFPEKPPSVLGITPMVVLSGSMSGDAKDHIEAGDLIFIGRADPEELQPGDIIAYMEGKVVITHRILEVVTGEDGKLEYVTKGDANNTADLQPVHQDDLVGHYQFRIPKVGDFALFLQTPLGMVVFIGIPMFGFILYDLIRRRLYARQENKRTSELEAELERLRALAAEKEEQDVFKA